MPAQLATLTEKVETIARKRIHYSGFDGQYINGRWRSGHASGMLKDNDPYSGEIVAEISMGDLSDLDEAYQSAAEAQYPWATVLPAKRAAVLHRCADLMERRREEIMDWLIREAGSTRIKAGVEWQMLHAITREAASFPHRVAGSVLPIDEPGKESRVYRCPVGVVGVISPWIFRSTWLSVLLPLQSRWATVWY